MSIRSRFLRSVGTSCFWAIVLAFSGNAQRGAVEVQRFTSIEQLQIDGVSWNAPLPRARMARSNTSGQRPAVLLTGYWPPTNEAIRPFSTNAAQNPSGWIGSDWEGRGYDVYSFFPEFNDPNCTNCGQGMGDLEVDYQDTSLDFWTFADQLEPIAVITLSRGFDDMSWEVELNQFNRLNWFDDYTAPVQPTPAPPNPNEPVDALLTSKLPLQHIINEVNSAHSSLDPFICVSGDGGAFLSEFSAYHGVWYQNEHADPQAADWCVTAGHVHVGGQIDWATAQAALETTLYATLDYVDAIVSPGPCATDLGFAGPGSATLELCGDLSSGGTATLRIDGPPQASGWLFVSATQTSIPLAAGTLIAFPPVLTEIFSTGPSGAFQLYDIPGGGGPLTFYAQYVYLDTALPGNLGFTNGIEIAILP